MIPIPWKYIPSIIKKNRILQIILSVLFFVLVILFIFWQAKQMVDSFSRGPDLYDEMELPITHELLDSAAKGLSIYQQNYGHYPQIEGKYFLDSIKQYININDVYVYADSLSRNGDTIPVKKFVGKKFNYRLISHTYIGVGIRELTIIYRNITPNSYFLYSVGKNLIDEHGKGDDVVYKRRW